MQTPETDGFVLSSVGLFIVTTAVLLRGDAITRLTGLRSPEYLLVLAISLFILFLAGGAYGWLAGRLRKTIPHRVSDDFVGAAARYFFTALFSYSAGGIIARQVPAPFIVRGLLALVIFVTMLVVLNRLWVWLQRTCRGDVSATELAVLKNPSPSDGERLVRIMGDSSHDNSFAAAWALGQTGKANVPLLIATLQDPEPRMRELTALALEQLEADAADAVPALLAALNDADRDVRKAALSALGKIVRDDEQVTGTIIAALQSADGGELVTAASALADSSANDARTVPALLALATKDKTPWVVKCVIEEIGRLGPKAESAVPELTKFIAHEDLDLVDAARKALEQITGSPPDMPADLLARLCEDPPVTFAELRKFVEKGKSLGPPLKKVVYTRTRGYPKSFDIFTAYFAQLNPDERARAVKLLRPHAIAGGTGIFEPGYHWWLRFLNRPGILSDLLSGWGSGRPVRWLAARCLASCGQLTAPVLEEALARDSWNLGAAQELLRLQPGSKVAAGKLRSVLMCGDCAHRLEAARIFGEYADAQASAADALSAACHDPHPPVRGAAVAALDKLNARTKIPLSFDPALFDDSAESVRWEVLRAVSRIGAADPRVLAKALALLTDASARVRAAAAQALGVIGTSSPQVVEALRKAESDGRHAVRQAAREALQRCLVVPE